MLEAQDPVVCGKECGELLAGFGRIALLPGPVGEPGAGAEGVVLPDPVGIATRARVGDQPEQVPGCGES